MSAPVRAEPSPVPSRPCAGRPLAIASAGRASVSHVAYLPDYRLGRHTHARPAINYVVAGEVQETTRRGVIVLPANALYLRAAGEVHSNVVGRDGSRILVIELPGESALPEGAPRQLFARSGIMRSARALQLAKRMLWEVRHPDAVTPLALEGMLLDLLATLIRTSRGPHRVTGANWIRVVREYLDANFQRSIHLRTLAELAGVHPAHLSRAFKRSVGVTPWRYQRDLRVDWVRRELAETSRAITDIACDAGFADHSHLNRALRASTGGSPSAIRRAAMRS
jgi:AraC family transcriptional regulator